MINFIIDSNSQQATIKFLLTAPTTALYT